MTVLGVPPPPPPDPTIPPPPRGPPPPPPPALPAPCSPCLPSPPTPTADVKLPQQETPLPKTKMKTINWNKIPNNKVILGSYLFSLTNNEYT